jgi:energy-coupling factor transporter ATP-binding protein EcfA2
MVDAGFDDRDRRFTSDESGARFFETPFLREILNDLTLALDLGRPAFLLGPAGSGKSALASQAAALLGQRYGVARLGGRRNLGLDEVVGACRQGFAPEAWADLTIPRPRTPERPGDSVLIVDDAEAIPPRFIEQLIAMSNGSPDLLPSHRVLFAGREALADVIETGRVRNNWGVPLVLTMPSWPDDAARPFLRHRLRAAGLGDPDLLSDAAIGTIAADAQGNPGRMLELAQRILLPDEPQDWIEPPSTPPPMARRDSTIIDLEPVGVATGQTTTVLFAEPPPVLAPSPPSVAGMLARLPLGPRRALHLALPVVVVVAAGLLIWALDEPPPAPKPLLLAALPVTPAPEPVVVRPAPVPAAAAPPPPVVLAPSPMAAPPAPVAAVPPPAAPPVPAGPTVPVETLIGRGDALLAGGDFAAARLFYLQAARAGSAKAATSVARTYDPLALDRLGVVGGHGEPAKAVEWYRKAVDLGDPAAAEPLQRLSPH